MRVVLLATCVVLGACAAQASSKPSAGVSSKPAEPAPEQASGPNLDHALTGLPTPESSPVVAPEAGDNLGRDPYAGVVNRAGLVTIVDQGLGRFLGRLRLSPVVTQGRFVGFGVTGIDPAWGDVGLRPGDVILRVNGQPIERPEQAMAVFEGLKTASEIAVDLTREGVPATLRFRVD